MQPEQLYRRNDAGLKENNLTYTYKDALEQEIAVMFGNLRIEWRPRANAELFESLLERQYDVWLQELANVIADSCGHPVPLAFDGETVMPAVWLDDEDNFNAERVVCQDDSRLCRSMNKSWYDILHVVNLYCATIKQEIPAWWNDKRRQGW